MKRKARMDIRNTLAEDIDSILDSGASEEQIVSQLANLGITLHALPKRTENSTIDQAKRTYATDLVKRYGSELLTRADLARELGRSSEALRQAEKGDLRGLAKAAKVQIGRQIRFRATAVAHWIETQSLAVPA